LLLVIFVNKLVWNIRIWSDWKSWQRVCICKFFDFRYRGKSQFAFYIL